MPWALLLDVRIWLASALVITGLYAAVQRVEKNQIKAEYAQFIADVESEAAKAKVAAAQEAARRAQNAQEVVSDLQARFDALNSRYRILRTSSGSGTVPALSSSATSIAACSCGQPDAAPRFVPEGRCLAALEAGDREIAKYRELWRLQEKNSGSPGSPL